MSYRGVLLSDFNVSNLAGYLRNAKGLPALEVTATPFGQVMPALMDSSGPTWQDCDFAVVWTRPQSVIPSFNDVLEFHTPDIDQIMCEVDDYAELLRNATARVKVLLVPSWTVQGASLGMLDMDPTRGIQSILMRMNLRLADSLAGTEAFVLDSSRWIASAGPKAVVPKLWYLSKTPFGNDVFKTASADIHAALSGVAGHARKLVILDLDNTLWGGIVGDDEWENLRLGGHDHLGEAFADFQRGLKALTNRGIILGIASKNEEEVALEAIDNHPEMILSRDDFAGWRINWSDKAANIIDLVEEIDLGLQSVVFIDDNPVERDRVRKALPEVLVPEWPSDPTLYRFTLDALRCFDSPFISEEDTERAKMYTSRRERQSARTEAGSMDGWLASLETRVKIEKLTPANLQRTAQLLNKTNQMNLSTRRLPEKLLGDWAAEEQNHLWTVRVSDRFGDSGLTGIMSLHVNNEGTQIIDFILSCRVMGRCVEETMLSVLLSQAHDLGVEQIEARYLPTKKNKPLLQFLLGSEMAEEGDGRFTWDCTRDDSLPDSVTLEM